MIAVMLFYSIIYSRQNILELLHIIALLDIYYFHLNLAVRTARNGE